MESGHRGHNRAVPLTTEGGLLSCERSWLTLERKTPREGRLLSGLGRRRSQPEWRVSAAQVCIQDMAKFPDTVAQTRLLVPASAWTQ